MNTIKIVYITGFGRSGSTLLDILLASAPSAFGCGELNALLRDGIFQGDPCACGEPVANCPLWQDVMKGWPLSRDAASLNRYSGLVDRVDSVRLSNQKLAFADQEFFRTQTASLYQSITRVTGATVLIESSKSPNRLRHLIGVPGVSVRAIHLIRDVASVARSMARPWQADPSAGISHEFPGKSVLRTAVAWRIHNVMADRVCRSLDQSAMRVHMEQLLTTPNSVLRSIGHHVGLDLSHACHATEVGEPILIEHTVAGNRLRMQKSLIIRPSEAGVDCGFRSRMLRHLALSGLGRDTRKRLQFSANEFVG
jgi:hypothetical protein